MYLAQYHRLPFCILFYIYIADYSTVQEYKNGNKCKSIIIFRLNLFTVLPYYFKLLIKNKPQQNGKDKKKAIRIITKSEYNAHTVPLLFDNEILPIDKSIKMAKLLFMHSIFYDYAPRSFMHMWTRNNERQHAHNLRNDND